MLRVENLHIRRGEPALCGALFTADGAFEMRQGDPRDPASVRQLHRAEGRGEVIAYISASTSDRRMFPMIHNLLIEVSGDVATASSLMVGRVWPDGGEVMGDYADSFRRSDEGWLFAERIYTICRTG